MSSNFVCIHGHFYQPPRENPFTGLVADQPSAAPYPNWNERITAESYLANANAPILDSKGVAGRTINNYEWISFDFGPTLLSWLEKHSPETYRAIVEADHSSAGRFGGHGSAMAQGYNHTILPLSTSRDKRTQIRWGIADFRHRFGRSPEGMWLPETAVDLETLGLLADEGILFTVLSPYQAAEVMATDGTWIDVSGGRIDTRNAYRVELPNEARISVFFYNGPLSQDIAFNGMLDDGRELAGRLVGSIGAPTGRPLLAHVATDGETYGHHHRYGEMALASAIETIEFGSDAVLANYGQFLEMSPPETTARIIENSSWSCAHGVERWRADCGCSTGGHAGWKQDWRGPLRQALDWLRDAALEDFLRLGSALFRDPWEARDDYVEIILGEPAEGFLARHLLESADGDQALALLQIQHHALLMYTSCGWFFDDVARLEAVFVLRQAGRVIDLIRAAIGSDLEPQFKRLLDLAPSNEGGTARDVYEREVTRFMAGR